MRLGVAVDGAFQVHRLIHPGAAPERGEFVAEERYAVNTVLGLFYEFLGQRSCHRPSVEKTAQAQRLNAPCRNGRRAAPGPRSNRIWCSRTWPEQRERRPESEKLSAYHQLSPIARALRAQRRRLTSRGTLYGLPGKIISWTREAARRQDWPCPRPFNLSSSRLRARIRHSPHRHGRAPAGPQAGHRAIRRAAIAAASSAQAARSAAA